MDFYAIFGTPPTVSIGAARLRRSGSLGTRVNHKPQIAVESCRSQCVQLTLGQLNMNIVSSRPSVFSHVHTD